MYRHLALPLSFMILMLSLSGCVSLAKPESDADKPIDEPERIDPMVHVREGDKAAASGEFDKALVQYVIALEEDGRNADLFYKVGFIHQSQGRMDLAERSFNEALQNAPEHVSARLSLGLIALRKKNHDYAESVLIKVLEQDPDNWRALNALGVLNDLRENFVEARRFYDAALAQVPGSVDVLNNLGYSLYLQSEWKEAEEYFKKVVEQDPGYDHGWSNLALVYLKMDEVDLAKIAFRNVVSEHQALNNIGYFSLLSKDTESARQRFRDATQLAPSYYALAYRNLASVDAREAEASRVEPEEERVGARAPEKALRSQNDARETAKVDDVADGQAVLKDTLHLRMPGW